MTLINDPTPEKAIPRKVQVILTLSGVVDVSLDDDNAGYTAADVETRLQEQRGWWTDDPFELAEMILTAGQDERVTVAAALYNPEPVLATPDAPDPEPAPPAES